MLPTGPVLEVTVGAIMSAKPAYLRSLWVQIDHGVRQLDDVPFFGGLELSERNTINPQSNSFTIWTVTIYGTERVLTGHKRRHFVGSYSTTERINVSRSLEQSLLKTLDWIKGEAW